MVLVVDQVVDAELVLAAVGVEVAGCGITAINANGLGAGDAVAVCGADLGAGGTLSSGAEEGAFLG